MSDGTFLRMTLTSGILLVNPLIGSIRSPVFPESSALPSVHVAQPRRGTTARINLTTLGMAESKGLKRRNQRAIFLKGVLFSFILGLVSYLCKEKKRKKKEVDQRCKSGCLEHFICGNTPYAIEERQRKITSVMVLRLARFPVFTN